MPKTTTQTRQSDEIEQFGLVKQTELLDLVVRFGEDVVDHYRSCKETTTGDCEALAALITEARLMADRIGAE